MRHQDGRIAGAKNSLRDARAMGAIATPQQHARTTSMDRKHTRSLTSARACDPMSLRELDAAALQLPPCCVLAGAVFRFRDAPVLLPHAIPPASSWVLAMRDD